MLNKVILIGRCGNDPEIRYTTSGDPVASFSLATSETWKNKQGNKQEKTVWHNIVIWRKLAEIVGEYVKKGSLLYLEGKIESREYEDREGTKRRQHSIVVDTMKMLGGGKDSSSHSSNKNSSNGNNGKVDNDGFIPEEEDLPI